MLHSILQKRKEKSHVDDPPALVMKMDGTCIPNLRGIDKKRKSHVGEPFWDFKMDTWQVGIPLMKLWVVHCINLV